MLTSLRDLEGHSTNEVKNRKRKERGRRKRAQLPVEFWTQILWQRCPKCYNYHLSPTFDQLKLDRLLWDRLFHLEAAASTSPLCLEINEKPFFVACFSSTSSVTVIDTNRKKNTPHTFSTFFYFDIGSSFRLALKGKCPTTVKCLKSPEWNLIP